MTRPSTPRPSADESHSEGHSSPSNEQAHLEQAWHSRLLVDPSDAAFREAYDALHVAMQNRPDRKDLYELSLTRLDRAFLAALGSACRVLDVGSGNGRFPLAASKLHWTVAVEISTKAIEAMRTSAGTRSALRICQASALHLPFMSGTFDAVVSQDLIEHLHPDHLGAHLAEVCRVLTPGGRYLLHTPSSLHGPTSLGLHLREYRLRELRQIAEAAGFRARWLCLNLARLGWTGMAPTWLWPIIKFWEAFWGTAGDLGLRRLGGRGYIAGIPDVDLDLLKSE